MNRIDKIRAKFEKTKEFGEMIRHAINEGGGTTTVSNVPTGWPDYEEDVPYLLSLVERLGEALRELLEAETAHFPPASEGRQAQSDWARRQAAAEELAAKLLEELK